LAPATPPEVILKLESLSWWRTAEHHQVRGGREDDILILSFSPRSSWLARLMPTRIDQNKLVMWRYAFVAFGIFFLIVNWHFVPQVDFYGSHGRFFYIFF